MGFGSYIRAAREARGVTLNGLAPRMGLSPAYWSRIELERENPPRDEVLELLVKELDLDRDDVFVQAGRLPPEMRSHLAEIVKMWRRKEKRNP